MEKSNKVPSNKAAEFKISTVLNKETKHTFVQMNWGEQVAQLTPLQARQHALAILEAADAATTDLLMFEWLQDAVGMSEEQAMGAMASFRDARAKQHGQG